MEDKIKKNIQNIISKQINNQLQEKKIDIKFYDKLMDHQKYIIQVFQEFQLQNIILNHKPGSGKTISAISICNLIYQFSGVDKKIFILSQKNLQQDPWIKTMNEWFMGINEKQMFDYYAYDKEQDYLRFISDYDSFQGKKILIIDEVHNFIQDIRDFIINKSQVYIQEDFDRVQSIISRPRYKFYKYLLEKRKNKLLSYELQIIQLSGKLIQKDPFELSLYVYLFQSNILPTDYQKFQELYFINGDFNLNAKNSIIRRLQGFISYYQNQDDNQKLLPQVDDQIINLIPSQQQKELYSKYQSNFKSNASLITIPTIKQYKLSGIERIVDQKNYKELLYTYLNTKNEKEINNWFQTYSIKYYTMMTNITQWNKTNKGVFLIYLEIIQQEGVHSLQVYLKLLGYSLYKLNEKNEKKNYAIMSGQQRIEDRIQLLEIFNSEENKYGDLIQIMIISSVAQEGLTFKNVRQFYILNQINYESKFEQVYHRAIRFKSHSQLKPQEQKITVYQYILDIKDSYDFKQIEKLNINKNNIKHFNDIIKIVSYECNCINDSDKKNICFQYPDQLLFDENDNLFENDFKYDIEYTKGNYTDDFQQTIKELPRVKIYTDIQSQQHIKAYLDINSFVYYDKLNQPLGMIKSIQLFPVIYLDGFIVK